MQPSPSPSAVLSFARLAAGALIGASAALLASELRRRRTVQPAVAQPPAVPVPEPAEPLLPEEVGDYLVFDLSRDETGCRAALVEGRISGDADLADLVGQAALAAHANGMIALGQG